MATHRFLKGTTARSRRGHGIATAVAIAAVVASVAAAGAAGAPKASPPKKAADQTLTIAQAIVPILDPAFFGTSASWTIQSNLFATLTVADPKTHVAKPNLATSWSSSQGGKVWTFQLRHDAKFSDGKPITSQDVRYSLMRTVNPVTADQMKALGVTNLFPEGVNIIPELVGVQDVVSGKATAIPSSAITAPTKYSVRLNLTAPRADIPQRLANPVMAVVEAANVATSSAASPWWQHPAASGPFEIAQFTPNVSFALQPNPRYFGPKPILKRVNFPFITSVQTAEIAYEAGNVDFLKTVYSDVLNLESSHKSELHAYADNNTSVMLVNNNYPTSNPHVVKALTMALDKKTLAHTVLDNLPRVANTFTGPQWPGYSAKGYKLITYDPTGAKAELAKSGISPSAITIRLTYSGSQDPRAAQVIAQEWQQTLGIRVIILTTAPAPSAPADQAVNMYLQAQGPKFISPCSMVQRIKDILVTGAGAHNSSINPASDIEPQLDGALEACYTAPPSKVWAKVMAVETLNQQHQVFVPVFWNTDYYLYKPWVKNVTLGSNWNIENLSKVWIAAH